MFVHIKFLYASAGDMRPRLINELYTKAGTESSPDATRDLPHNCLLYRERSIP
jgi:hypothetical protein